MPYIEHQLKVRIEDENGYKNDIVEGIFILPDEILTLIDAGDWYFHTDFNDFAMKPILRPLSELRKKEWYDKFGGWNKVLDDISKGKVDYNKICYSKLRILFKHHFDVFGLIEKGLAISF